MKVVKHYHRSPREAVDTPSLETFKDRLVEVLNNLVLKLSYDSMINSRINSSNVKTQIGYTEDSMHDNTFWFFTASCEKAPPVRKIIRNVFGPANYTEVLYVQHARTSVLILYLSPTSF